MFLSGSEIPQGWVVNLDPQLPGSLQQGHLDPARGRHLPLWVVSISATMSETPSTGGCFYQSSVRRDVTTKVIPGNSDHPYNFYIILYHGFRGVVGPEFSRIHV